MGFILNASCQKCGFDEQCLFGAGMINGDTTCLVPGINRHTGFFEVANLLEENITASTVFYHEPFMHHGDSNSEGINWFDISLQPAGNLCPVCKHYSMTFTEAGMFD